MALTEQQRRALTARGVSVALSAGAGCGKTFVLTERFLAQLEPPAGPHPGPSPEELRKGTVPFSSDENRDSPHVRENRDSPRGSLRPARLSQLVAITFTERAAREMRDRIRDACGKRLLACGEDEVEHWSSLIRELDTARISTIHAFCGSLLRAHAVEARLDPRFRVLDQAQADTLLHELIDERLRQRLAERDEAVIDLVVQFGLDSLAGRIAALLGRRQEIDWAQWRGETADGLVARWADYWRNHALPKVLRQIAGSAAARTVLELAREHAPAHATMQQRCRLLLDRLPGLPESADPAAELAVIREAAKVQSGGGKKAWPSEDVYSQFSSAAKELRDLIDGLKGSLQFDAEAAKPAAAVGLRLLSVTDAVAEAYQQQKQELAVLDFNDLLIAARNLTAGADGAALRKRLAAQIRLLLVDEFQDTDPLQVELVESLCGEELLAGRLFFVGDYKQSIYRFRGADPRVFRRLSERMPAAGRLPLSLNFRSQPAVLGFINALFCEAFAPDYEPLRPHRTQVAPTPGVEFLWAAPADAANTAMGATERLRRLEADWIARRIRAMLDSGERIVWDPEAAKAGRPAARAVRPGDVALLFRALSNVEWYEEALRRYDIDYYLVGGHAFYSQQEVFDLLNLLRAINDPADAVSLAGALRSPWFSLLDETLFWLARHAQGLGAGLTADSLPAELTDAERRRAEFAAATLGDLRAMKDRFPIAQLINEAMARTGYDAVVLAEFLGARKLANLRKLIEQARSFDRSGIFLLADFITQLSQFVARQPDEALAATHAESTDVVRLMTIHQSKGLEFPVVIVPDVDRVRRGRASSVAFSPQLGPMVKDPGAATGFDLHQLAEGEEDRAELIRLLYVATTRAADYLILSAGLPELGASKGPWMELLSRRFDPATGRLRGGLPDGYDVPEITVTTAEPSLGTVPIFVSTKMGLSPLTPKRLGSGPRRDVRALVEKARQMAAEGSGGVPRHLARIAPDASARRQYSFSRLSGTLHGPRPESEAAEPAADATAEGTVPIFVSTKMGLSPLTRDAEPGLDPLRLGTLVHAVLAEADFAAPGDVAALVRRHAPRHLPEQGERLDEPIDLVGRFLASPRAKQLAAARQVHREIEFLLAWPPGARQSDGRYLQGFIDCLYQDDAGHWRLLDYKTNRVTAAQLEAEAANYEVQMLVYALAVERILKCPPEELVLCFLRPAAEYHFSWNDAARQRVVALVDEAIEQQ